MIAHLASGVKPRLEELDYPVHIGWAYPASDSAAMPAQLPYIVLAGPAWSQPDEAPVCGPSDALDGPFRLTAVAGNPEAAAVVLRRARAILSPGGEWAPIPMAGRHAETQYVRSEFIGVDQDLRITQTNRHPGVGVDTYRLVSHPTD